MTNDERQLYRQLVLLGAILGSRFPQSVGDDVQPKLFSSVDIGACVEEALKFASKEIGKEDVYRVRQYFADTLGVDINNQVSPLAALAQKVIEDGREVELKRIGRYLLNSTRLNDEDLAALKERVGGL